MKKLFAFSLILLSPFSARAEQAVCPALAGTYCCGISLGDIQACTTPKYIEQEAIEGGQMYSIYNPQHQRTSVWRADGKAHYVEDSFLKGTETITCQTDGISTNIPDAVLTQRPDAKGYFRGGLYLGSDGKLSAPANCIFTAPDGHQVYNCGGLQTGYACYKKQ
jgi:hypothetical protein